MMAYFDKDYMLMYQLSPPTQHEADLEAGTPGKLLPARKIVLYTAITFSTVTVVFWLLPLFSSRNELMGLLEIECRSNLRDLTHAILKLNRKSAQTACRTTLVNYRI
jgi:hypothetical protein